MMENLRVLGARVGSLVSVAILVIVLAGVAAAPAAAQTPTATPAAAAPDFSKLGFPTVAGTVSYTPGTAATINGSGGLSATIPANFYTGPATIDLLTGPASAFSAGASGNTVLAPFALRVTDTSTGKLVATGFGSPWTFQYTGPGVAPGSLVMNVTAATPPAITVNGTAPTVNGQTLTHPFTSASVGWLVANPAGSAAAPPAGRPLAVQGPARAPAASQAAAAKLPSTGTGGLLASPVSTKPSAALVSAALGLLLLAAVSLRIERRSAAEAGR